MKRLLFVLSIVFIFAGYVFADEIDKSIDREITQETVNQETENKGDDNTFLMVSMLLKQEGGLNKNFFQIQEASKNLTDTQKVMLYNMNESKTELAFALNFLIGFGIGSAIQNDIPGVITGSLGDGLGVILLSVGIFMISDTQTDWDTFEVTTPNFDKGMNLIITSSIILGASRLFQIIRPFAYAPKHNQKLMEALNYGNLAFNLAPSIDIKGNAGIALAVNYKY